MKSKVYVETTVVSYLVGWLSKHDLYVAANQEYTRQWWSERRHDFSLFTSAVVVKEARDGTPALAEARLEYLREMIFLEVTDEAEELQHLLLLQAALPRKAELDALHIAVAAVNGMDYLISWNLKHIVNATMLPKIYAICLAAGYDPPFVCTPSELMEGQQ